MLADWIQFGVLLLGLLLLALRTEHRITKVEEGIITDRQIRNMLARRIEQLERRRN